MDFHVHSTLCIDLRTGCLIVLSISICNHTHSSPIWEIIVLSNNKIVLGEAEYNFPYCVYNYFPNWTRMCVIAY